MTDEGISPSNDYGYTGEPRDLPVPDLGSIVEPDLTDEQRQRMIAESIGMPRGGQRDDLGIGHHAEEEQRRLQAIADSLLPKIDKPSDPMGPDIEVPHSF